MAKNQNINDEIISKQKQAREEALNHERDLDADIYKRLYEIMREVWYIEKYKEGSSPYNTVEHDDVTRKIRPSFVKHGVFYHIKNLHNRELITLESEKYDYKKEGMVVEHVFVSFSEFTVVFRNVDNSDDFLEVPTFSISKDSNPMTLAGKNISYGAKMAILKTLNLETGDREDIGEIAEKADKNAVEVYNLLGTDLFGDDWEEMSKKKIYRITKRKTAEAERAPTWAINEAIKNLLELKKKQEEEPDKKISEIDEETEKENDKNSDIMKDFED